MRLHYYILIGLLGWGLPAVAVVGPQAFVWVIAAALPVWLASRRVGARRELPKAVDAPVALLGVLAILYVALDATLGRQKLAANMFLSPMALDVTIASINQNVSQGRGVVELVGALSIFIPFALCDLARSLESRRSRLVLRVVAGLFIFYEVGVSRGYAVMSVAALMLGAKATRARLASAGLFSLAVFSVSSMIRGDFGEVTYSNPLFDGVVWPYVNLEFLLKADCGNASWTDFLLECVKKIVPAFLFPKEVYSFNVEMTRCVYPSFANYVESVSIFTYLGEFVYYSPSVVTALVAGLALASLCTIAEAMLMRYGVMSTRMFAGLMCIVLLRSRVLDVASFLLFLIAFGFTWGVCVIRDLRLTPHSVGMQRSVLMGRPWKLTSDHLK